MTWFRGFESSRYSLWLWLAAMMGFWATAAEKRTGEPRVFGKDGVNYLGWPTAEPFYVTKNPVRNLHLIDVGDVQIVLWREINAAREAKPFYAISFKAGDVPLARAASYDLKLRYDTFDPLQRIPAVVDLRTGDGEPGLHIVQFHTQTLEAYRDRLRSLGATVHHFLANYAHLVKMDAPTRDQVAALPFVRWVGPYEPAFRLENFLLDNLDRAEEVFPRLRYNILLLEAGPGPKQTVANRIRAMGGSVDSPNAGKALIEATLTPAQLFQAINMDEVVFVDRWSPLEPDMDVARAIGGADFIETVAGYTGAGVRGEVLDTGFNVTHVDFASRPLIEHTAVGSSSHGAATSGILFGDGTGNPQARGMLPDGQGIIADVSAVFTGPDRYTHIGELIQAPYFAVFHSASVGSSRTVHYNNISVEMDTALFDFDILHCQSQSNALDRYSRPQAWSKNIVSGGGVRHFNTLDKSDDCWGCQTTGASIGPAADGRIKPDLSHFYDSTFTVTSGGNTAYGNFGGTSGATPIIAGHFGLFFQMWSDGIFGNPVDGGGTVFDNRPHLSTAKAMLLNTASQYDFEGGTHDLSRVRQGWGMPDLQRMYELRDRMLIVDETDLLGNLEARVYAVTVAAAEPEFRATLTFLDPPGLPASTQARVNDLSLRVTSPAGTVFWGNHGLMDHNFSLPGGAPNQVDTVENVWVENPEAGLWTVEVIAHEINQDSHVETPELDADFALVVSGVQSADPALSFRFPQGLPPTVQVNSPRDFLLEVRDGGEILNPASVNFHYRFDAADPFTTVAMTQEGGNQFRATLPGAGCGDTPQFYFSAQGDQGTTLQFPDTAPVSWFEAEVFGEFVLFEFDMESEEGWTVGAGDDDATAGIWARVDPLARDDQPQTDHTPEPGRMAFVTEQETDDNNSTVTPNDVDNGKTTLISPLLDSAGLDVTISYWRWYSNHTGTAQDDVFQVDVSDDDGASWVNVETIGPTGPGTAGGWLQHAFRLADFVALTDRVRLRFVAEDTGTSSLVEAAVDDVKIAVSGCDPFCQPGVFGFLLEQWPQRNVLEMVNFTCSP